MRNLHHREFNERKYFVVIIVCIFRNQLCNIFMLKCFISLMYFVLQFPYISLLHIFVSSNLLGPPRILWKRPCSSSRPSVCNIISSRLAHYFVLIFCMRLGFNKHINSKACFFEKISCYAQNGVKGAFLDLNWTLFNFPFNLFIRFFWNCTWWQALKNG